MSAFAVHYVKTVSFVPPFDVIGISGVLKGKYKLKSLANKNLKELNHFQNHGLLIKAF
jgi:hypothetical protein